MGVVWFVLFRDRCSTGAQTLHCLHAYLNVACLHINEVYSCPLAVNPVYNNISDDNFLIS